MALLLGPRPLPTVVLTRDLGDNARREADAAGLVRVSHGAFVEPLGEEGGWEREEHLARARVRAASHRLTSSSVFSHESAALIHGLWLLRTPQEVHVVQGSTRRQSAGLRRHTAELPAGQVVEVDGVRATSVERTIVDCAKSMHPRDALVVADSGLRLLTQPHRDQRMLTAERTETVRERLLAMVEEGPPRGRRQARAVVAHADPYAESPYETVIRWVAVSRGLPPPALQVRFVVRGRTYYTDLCWHLEFTIDGQIVRIRLIAEYDGEGKYLGAHPTLDAARAAAERVIAEKEREDDLRSMPHTQMVRFARRDAWQIDATFRRLCSFLPATYTARLRLVPALAGLVAPRRGGS